MPEMWKEIAAQKQKQRDERIPKEWKLSSLPPQEKTNVLDIPHRSGILTSEELRITESYDASDLVTQLASGRLKSVEVTTAFCKRAAIAQQVSNCLTEIFFDDALARARELDEHWQRYKTPKGPLHGLPISLKDSFKVKGYDASTGIASLCFKPASSNSALVDLLLDAGAVLYCKTNVPQTLGALDSHNHVFGRTLNPINRRLTAGGSSGGEGALIAMRGSPLGVGTDVGGSIRIPSMNNGLVGVKPSHGRVPYAGQENVVLPGINKVGMDPTAGPIAHSVRDCEMFFRIVSEASPNVYDPEVIPQTWNQMAPLQTQRPLLIGIVKSDGLVEPLPPIRRLIDEVAQSLRNSGQPLQVIEVDMSFIGPRLLKGFNDLMSPSGTQNTHALLEKTGEPLSPWLKTRLPKVPAKTVEKVRQAQAQRADFQAEFNKIWHEAGGHWKTFDSKAGKGNRMLDVIICPVAPHPVPPIDRWGTMNYTGAFNVLDCPAGALPVRSMRREDLEGEVASSPAANPLEKANRSLWTERELYLGTPLSIQIVCPKLMDRKLFEAMGALEKTLKPLASEPVSKL
ncbi:amidase [Piedraia hortae CBS 480.64]|uniref:amidase n=1 Tax=Piedraia hortae CBS 480.64 TaxID=1314780 RepID=A0A6A7BRL7_9PEZI|nr:amidase [Piedraia hortae CBS 480.64]